MAGQDRVDPGDPLGEVAEETGALEGPSPDRYPQTFVAGLQGVVDGVRKLGADLGARPYRVFLVHGQWSGERRGVGELQVVSRREILPPPRVQDATRRSPLATGTTDEGEVVVDRISARIPEDDLLGLTPDLLDPARPRTLRRNVSFWWEIEEARPAAPAPRPRRFSPPRTTLLRRTGMQWRVTLTRQDSDRPRGSE